MVVVWAMLVVAVAVRPGVVSPVWGAMGANLLVVFLVANVGTGVVNVYGTPGLRAKAGTDVTRVIQEMGIYLASVVGVALVLYYVGGTRRRSRTHSR